jgi:hypothetical protein
MVGYHVKPAVPHWAILLHVLSMILELVCGSKPDHDASAKSS